MSSAQGRIRIAGMIKNIRYKQKILLWVPRCKFVNVRSVTGFMAHVRKREMCTSLYLGKVRETGYLQDLRVDVKIILNLVLKK